MKRCLSAVFTFFLLSTTVGVLAAPVLGQGTWETTLQGRDLDGDNKADAFYDSVLHVTWLRDVSGNGVMNWIDAMAWASHFEFANIAGWRLPTIIDKGFGGCNNQNQGGTDCGYNVLTPPSSEMAFLWYVTLANKAICTPGDSMCWPNFQQDWGLKNTGEFQNIKLAFSDNPGYGLYWYGTEVLSPGPFVQPYSWFFDFNQGRQSITIQSSLGFAMLVHDGDIGTPISAVPEPQSLALLAQHRRTESDYMGVLLDTVTLNDWRSVVNGALQAAKAGDPQARNWLAQYLVGRPEGKAPTPMNIVVQQLSGADPVVEKLAKPAISRALYPSSHRNDDFEAHIKALVAIELQAKVKPLETIETTTTARLCDDSGAKPSNELD